MNNFLTDIELQMFVKFLLLFNVLYFYGPFFLGHNLFSRVFYCTKDFFYIQYLSMPDACS